MWATTVLDGSAECRKWPGVPASLTRHALAFMLLALFAVHLADPAAAQASAGREVTITGERAKQQFAAGYRVHIGANVADDVISGTVGGKSDPRAKEIVIASGAQLRGELVARSPKKPEIAPDASIAGPVREIETEVNIPDPKDPPRIIAWFAVAAAVILLLGVLLLGVLAQIVVPGPLSRSAARLRTELWGSIGVD